MKRHAIYIKNISGSALVPAAFFEHSENVRSFDFIQTLARWRKAIRLFENEILLA